MSKKFAKLFETTEGQIVAILKSRDDDGCPELRFFVKPCNGLDVCSLAYSFADTDEGWAKAEKALENVNEEMALKALHAVQGAMEE